MGYRARRRWCTQPLTPLLEGPDPDTYSDENKKESSWEIIRAWVRMQMDRGSFIGGGGGGGGSPTSDYKCRWTNRADLKLMLGVLGCPLAPISLPDDPIPQPCVKGSPIETSSANYIIQQYLAATGCLKQQKCMKSLYTTGVVKMVYCETEIGPGKNVKSAGPRGGESGCFVLWQMSPGMWSLEMVVAGHKVVTGCNGKIVWRHTPWLGIHAAKGPQRPLRRLIQGLDPKITASMFANAQCLGEKTIDGQDCFVLKVAADRRNVIERSDGPAEVIRHVLIGYFSQRSGLLIYMEDSHLTRVQTPGSDTIYWETTIGSSVEDYREVDGVLIAHQGRSVATVFRFGEISVQHSRTKMEELWRIDDVVFNVPGLSSDCFIPPADIYELGSRD
ncbi:uncharacterized protein [Aristolochia californica]|uniref:uncharacterized protein n=1 Tax=Aristolochia californica TaxID=171875 RepID=UPI0035DA07CD